MHDVAVSPISHFFHQDFAQTHIDAAFNLAHHQQRIDRFADVVRDPDTLDRDDAGVWVNIHFGNRGGITVGRRGTYAGAFVPAR